MHLFEQNAVRQLLDLPKTFRRPDLTFQQLMASFAVGLALLTEATDGTMSETLYQNASDGWIDVWGDLAGIFRHTGEADSLFQARIPNMLLAARDSAVAIETWLQIIEGVVGIVAENGNNVGYTVSIPATLLPARLVQILQNLAYVRPAGVPFNFLVRSGGTYLNTVDYLGSTLAGTNVVKLPGAGISAQNVQQQSITTGWQGGRVTGSYLTSASNPTGRTFLSTVDYFGARKTNMSASILTVVTAVPWQGGRVTGSYLASKGAVSNLTVPASTNNQISGLPDLLLTDPTLNPNVATPLTTA